MWKTRFEACPSIPRSECPGSAARPVFFTALARSAKVSGPASSNTAKLCREDSDTVLVDVSLSGGSGFDTADAFARSGDGAAPSAVMRIVAKVGASNTTIRWNRAKRHPPIPFEKTTGSCRDLRRKA